MQSRLGSLSAAAVVTIVACVAIHSVPASPIHAAEQSVTKIVSVDSDEKLSDFNCCYYMFHPGFSASGRFVAFTSQATNVADDGDYRREDVFLRDRRLGTTEQISIADNEQPVRLRAKHPAISANGRTVSFSSHATKLVGTDTNQAEDVFARIPAEGRTELVSVASDETQGNSTSIYSALSRSGRFVAFVSYASNLVPSDNNGEADVFVRDRELGTTERISNGVGGAEANGSSESETLSISATGRYVAFHSSASNLIGSDTNNTADVFVYDRQADTTRIVSVTNAGEQRPGPTMYPSMSADGSVVAFTSWSHLVPADSDKRGDIYVHNVVSGMTVRASVYSDGSAANGSSGYAAISGDGARVSFFSAATFSSKDPGNRQDIYLHDLQTGHTRLVSVALHDNRAPSFSYYSSLSHDGSKVAFASFSNDLVANDINFAADLFVRTYPAPPR